MNSSLRDLFFVYYLSGCQWNRLNGITSKWIIIVSGQFYEFGRWITYDTKRASIVVSKFHVLWPPTMIQMHQNYSPMWRLIGCFIWLMLIRFHWVNHTLETSNIFVTSSSWSHWIHRVLFLFWFMTDWNGPLTISDRIRHSSRTVKIYGAEISHFLWTLWDFRHKYNVLTKTTLTDVENAKPYLGLEENSDHIFSFVFRYQ